MNAGAFLGLEPCANFALESVKVDLPAMRSMSFDPETREKPSTSVFGAYSTYYDLLYRDKDYAAEASYVHTLIQQHQPRSASILDLGCGTGRHALLLAEQGYQIVGIDGSPEMLERAKTQLAASTPAEVGRRTSSGQAPEFVQGDIRSARIGQKFDVVISLFHVMSYHVTNEDLRAAFDTAKAHVKPGGLFVFDCWYGPAVLSIRPSVRIRRFEDERISVIRLAEPVLHANGNWVEVNYQVLIKDKLSGSLDELRETHRMRYLFVPEVAAFAEAAGFRVESALEFSSNEALGVDTWTAVFVARAAA
jgi:SAM-dependent methyltransferase